MHFKALVHIYLQQLYLLNYLTLTSFGSCFIAFMKGWNFGVPLFYLCHLKYRTSFHTCSPEQSFQKYDVAHILQWRKLSSLFCL